LGAVVGGQDLDIFVDADASLLDGLGWTLLIDKCVNGTPHITPPSADTCI